MAVVKERTTRSNIQKRKARTRANPSQLGRFCFENLTFRGNNIFLTTYFCRHFLLGVEWSAKCSPCQQLSATSPSFFPTERPMITPWVEGRCHVREVPRSHSHEHNFEGDVRRTASLPLDLCSRTAPSSFNIRELRTTTATR